MYCSQCGKKLADNSKFCVACGSPVAKEDDVNEPIVCEPTIDPVEDLKNKLKKIDEREKPKSKNEGFIKSAIKVAKKEKSVLSLVFSDDFDGHKLSEKKKLIAGFPLPESPKDLKKFAEYVYSEITARQSLDRLTETWKEKMTQIYQHAKKTIASTEEYAEIKKYYKRTVRGSDNDLLEDAWPFLFIPVIIAFILSWVFGLPLLMFAMLVVLGWGSFGVMYSFRKLDKMIDSIRMHSEKTTMPKALRVIAWHLPVPLLAITLVSIIFQWIIFIPITAGLFGVNVIFLLLFLLSAYGIE